MAVSVDEDIVEHRLYKPGSRAGGGPDYAGAQKREEYLRYVRYKIPADSSNQLVTLTFYLRSPAKQPGFDLQCQSVQALQGTEL